MWDWQNLDPFGNNVPNENPSGFGAFEFPIRFRGQTHDKETGLNQNFFRDYDPATGTYKEFDLIGLQGGINGYTYVFNNPLKWTDAMGLDVFICRRAADIAAGLVDHNWVKTDTISAGLGGNPNVRPGDAYDAPYVTKTYVIDHSKDKATSCEKMNNVDEQCVNNILSNELGTSQGRFGSYMNCQAYAYSVVNRCRSGPQQLPSSSK